MTLEARVKVLEDQWQRLAEAFLVAPTRQPQVNPLKKETQKTTAAAAASTLKWEPMPPTDKGPWEKTTDLTNSEAKEIINKFTSTKNTVFQNGYLYWPLKTDGKIEGLGRRKTT